MTEAELRELGLDTLCKGYKHRTYIPTKPSNPSKLELHYWDGHKWHPTGSVRFVPSYEWGANEDEIRSAQR